MKKHILIICLLMAVLTASAQEKKKFSPEKFEADMEEFITQEAGLNQQEASKVFPLLREMHEKQRTIYGKIQKQSKQTPADEAGWVSAVNEYDKLNIELKQIEKCYHKKMMQEVSAAKVYKVIKAEYRFHRRWMKGARSKDKRR